MKIRGEAGMTIATIGGLKIVTTSGWFRARPSGKKIFARSTMSLARMKPI